MFVYINVYNIYNTHFNDRIHHHTVLHLYWNKKLFTDRRKGEKKYLSTNMVVGKGKKDVNFINVGWTKRGLTIEVKRKNKKQHA